MSKARAFLIKGSYQEQIETIRGCDDEDEANRLVLEYKVVYGPAWAIWAERNEGVE